MTANNIPVAKDDIDVTEWNDDRVIRVADAALEAGRFELADACVNEATRRNLSLV
jgi:hypothetical protein